MKRFARKLLTQLIKACRIIQSALICTLEKLICIFRKEIMKISCIRKLNLRLLYNFYSVIFCLNKLTVRRILCIVLWGTVLFINYFFIGTFLPSAKTGLLRVPLALQPPHSLSLFAPLRWLPSAPFVSLVRSFEKGRGKLHRNAGKLS